MVGIHQIYLDGCQILLFLWRSLMDKTQPVRMAWIACIQDVKDFTFTATNLKHSKKNQHRIKTYHLAYLLNIY